MADARLTQLAGASALAVFRVAQEALSNVAKHARATSVDVRIATDGTHVTDRLRRWDRVSRSRRTGYGLAGMRARCEAFGGSFETATPATGHGTRVTARFAWDSLLAVPVAARRASLS